MNANETVHSQNTRLSLNDYSFSTILKKAKKMQTPHFSGCKEQRKEKENSEII